MTRTPVEARRGRRSCPRRSDVSVSGLRRRAGPSRASPPCGCGGCSRGRRRWGRSRPSGGSAGSAGSRRRRAETSGTSSLVISGGEVRRLVAERDRAELGRDRRGRRVESVARYWTNRPGGTWRRRDVGVGLLGRPVRPGRRRARRRSRSGPGRRPTSRPASSALQADRAEPADRAWRRGRRRSSVPPATWPGSSRTTAPGSPVAEEQAAVGLGQQGEDLAVVEPGDRGRLAAGVADLVELPLGPGADEEPVVLPGQGVDQDLGPEDLAGDAVGADPVDGVVARRGRPGRRRPAGRGAGPVGPRPSAGSGRVGASGRPTAVEARSGPRPESSRSSAGAEKSEGDRPEPPAARLGGRPGVERRRRGRRARVRTSVWGAS